MRAKLMMTLIGRVLIELWPLLVRNDINSYRQDRRTLFT